MPTFDYLCKKCGKVKEFNTSSHMPKGMQPPDDMLCIERIPKECKDGKTRNYQCKGDLEKMFGGSTAFDIVGYCYENEYGKKAWKKNMSQSEQAEVLTGNKNPY